LNIQADNQNSGSNEALFEYLLKQITVRAFDALLTCGVRGHNALLRLTEEILRQFAVPHLIIDELMGIQLQLREQTTKSDQTNN
jgi:hypothetical protein